MTRTSADLLGSVRSLLARAAQSYGAVPAAQNRLQAVLDRLDEPLRVAIAGKVKAGKSTLLNALVGEELAPELVAAESSGRKGAAKTSAASAASGRKG